MNKIKAIKIEIMPQYFTRPGGDTMASIRVEAHVYGQPETVYEQTMPENDFESLFDTLMDIARKEIKSRFEQSNKGD